MSTHLLDYASIVPVFEPLDSQAGIQGDSFKLGGVAKYADVILMFGAVTGDSIMSVYCGATADAKTTKIPFRSRFSGGDYKAASADQYAATVTDADGDLTLTAATYDHRILVIHIDAAELPDGKPWVTIDVDATSSVLLMAGCAVLTGARYTPAPTAIV